MTAAEIAGLFGELELLLVASLKRNLARHQKQEQREGSRGGVLEHWEAWQAAKLRDIARFRRENRALLGQYAPLIDRETHAMIVQQAAEGGSDGFFCDERPAGEGAARGDADGRGADREGGVAVYG